MTHYPTQSPLTLSALIDPLPAGAHLLDLGCGSGSFKYDAYPHLRISALDVAPPAMAGTFPPHVEFKLGVAAAIPEPDASIDLVIANFAFEHFPDGAAALREIDRILRDGAYAWMSMPNAASFEDQLYHNLFAGGGHLQCPSFEWFLRHAYTHTSLKLVSFIEIPAGFTFLGESPELRLFTWSIVDALCRRLSRDVAARSAYIFILRKFASAGPGYVEHLRTCSSCGSPDGNRGETSDTPYPQPWDCPSCGAHNAHPNAIPMQRLDDIERAVGALWERFPETSPEQLKKMMETRTEWARDLERQLEERTQWALRLDAELQALRQQAGHLQQEVDARGRWGQELDLEVRRLRDLVGGLQAEIGKLRDKFSWILSAIRKRIRR